MLDPGGKKNRPGIPGDGVDILLFVQGSRQTTVCLPYKSHPSLFSSISMQWLMPLQHVPFPQPLALASHPSCPSITSSPSSSAIMLMMLGCQLLTPRDTFSTLSMPSPQRGEPPSTPTAAQLRTTTHVPLCDLDVLLSSSSPRGSLSPGCPLVSPFPTWTSKSFFWATKLGCPSGTHWKILALASLY